MNNVYKVGAIPSPFDERDYQVSRLVAQVNVFPDTFVLDYQKEDLSWVELALCMRSAGLPVEVMIEYVKLYLEGDTTIPSRLQLLTEQKEVLLIQRKQIDATLD